MQATPPHTDAATHQSRSPVRMVLGLMFLLPSLLCCLTQLLVPTINTFLMSFRESNLFVPKATFVGLENYVRLSDDALFGQAAGFTFLMLLVRLFVVALVPLFLAWSVAQFGRTLRLGLRVLLTLPVAFFAPVSIAIAWLMLLSPARNVLPFDGSWLASPASARTTLLLVDALHLFGLACGLGLMAYLPLWRRSTDTPSTAFRDKSKPMLAVWSIGVLGVIALTMSTFTPSFVMTNGGPAGSTSSLGLLLYQLGFRNFDMGQAASIASLILLPTLTLGVLAGCIVVMNRLRLDLLDTKPALQDTSQPVAAQDPKALAGVVLALLGLLTLGICLLSALPFGSLIPQAAGSGGLGALLEEVSAGQLFINSLVPPFLGATVQILMSYLAALSLGALQPLGKRSEWLILLFSPWLFISILPLSLSNFLRAQEAGVLDTFLGSLSPILLNIPALFVLTIFFKGRAAAQPRERIQESQDTSEFFSHFVLPSLPLATVLWLLLFFFNGQEVIWPLLASVSPERYNLKITLLQLVRAFGGTHNALAAAITFFVIPASLFSFVCLALLQVFYLDRLVLYAASPTAGEVTQDSEPY